MSIKRMRVFAGPNGSGKTTIFKGILADNNVNVGVFVNADEIEQLLNTQLKLDLNLFGLTISQTHIQNFFRLSQFSPVKRNELDLYSKISIHQNCIHVNSKIDSYLAADIAEFLRQELLQNQLSFTYETVMSHSSKIDFLRKAKLEGFRVYLYFIATEDPEININRVQLRVAQDGHDVMPDIIKNRYFKSLQNLKEAVKQTDRTYIFDNSGTSAHLIAEVYQGTEVILNKAVQLPNWVHESLFKH
jgi:predicted ABC-type ATPase